MQSRFGVTLIFLTGSIIAALYLAYELVVDPSLGSLIGTVIGFILGVLSCYTLLHPSKSRRDSVEFDSSNLSRAMVISVVAGILLAKLVSNSFSPELQSAINNSIFAWIVVLFGWISVIAWLYMPKK